jgi:aspartokinase-like uncharacterized kinase
MSDRVTPVETVVKVGGGLLAHAPHFEAVLETLAGAARASRLLVVPGGGPFAEAVRAVDRSVRLSDDAAHWMAVLAMDQYAHLLVSRLAAAALVAGGSAAVSGEIAAALDGGLVPVLAPSRWLREADPLPHSWDVTSDSIAAWVAGAIGARRLVLIKPPHARDAGVSVVDASFTRVLPAGVAATTVAADQVDLLRAALAGAARAGR